MSISLRKARQIIKTAFAEGRARNLKPLSVIVLDAAGIPIAFEREDGAFTGRFDVAMGKAYGCVMLGMGGAALNARAEAQPYFITAMNGLFGGKVVPVQGGVLLRDAKGKVVGAVGVTGDTSEDDAACGLAGAAAAGLQGEA